MTADLAAAIFRTCLERAPDDGATVFYLRRTVPAQQAWESVMPYPPLR